MVAAAATLPPVALSLARATMMATGQGLGIALPGADTGRRTPAAALHPVPAATAHRHPPLSATSLATPRLAPATPRGPAWRAGTRPLAWQATATTRPLARLVGRDTTPAMVPVAAATTLPPPAAGTGSRCWRVEAQAHPVAAAPTLDATVGVEEAWAAGATAEIAPGLGTKAARSTARRARNESDSEASRGSQHSTLLALRVHLGQGSLASSTYPLLWRHFTRRMQSTGLVPCRCPRTY